MSLSTRRLSLLPVLALITTWLTTATSADQQDKAVSDYADTISTVQTALEEDRLDDAKKGLASTNQSLRSFEFALLEEQARRGTKNTGSLIKRLEMPKDVKTRYGVLNPTNRQLVFICQDGGLRVHDLSNLDQDTVLLPHGDKSAVWRGVFSHDGKRFFAGHQNGEVIVWNAETWKVIQTISIGSRPIRELAVAPDGSAFVAEGQQSLELWSLRDETPKKIGDVGDRFNFGEGLSFSPKGDLVATGGMFAITTYDANTGAEVQKMTHASYTMGLQFDPDGTRIASAPRGNVNKLLAVFEVKSGKRLFNVGPFKKYVVGLAFTPDGKRIAATGCEEVLRIFDSTTGQVVLKFDRPECGTNPAFTDDGRLLGWSEPSGYFFINLNSQDADKLRSDERPKSLNK